MNPTKLNQQNNVDTHTETPKRPLIQRLLAFAIIIALLAGGAFIAMQLIKTKPKAKKRPPKKMTALVSVMPLKPADHTVTLSAMGTVIPEKQITITPQVSGKIVRIHPNLKPGGRINKGDMLITIDNRDYLYTVQQKKAALEQAKADLLLEKGNQTVAQNDWKVVQSLVDNVSPQSSDLALRKPQLLKAESAVASAEASLRQARLNLSRTVIRAPFNAIILNKNVDIASSVSTGTQIATLVGIDAFWVETSIQKDRLAWINSKTPAITVISGEYEYNGILSGIEADLEKNGLMAKLLISVNNPMENTATPLLLGSFVTTKIKGTTLNNVFKIPGTALNENDEIMLAIDGQLDIRKPTVHWKNESFAYISEQFEPGEKLIVSKISAPVKGMQLQIAGKKGQDKKRKMKREMEQ